MSGYGSSGSVGAVGHKSALTADDALKLLDRTDIEHSIKAATFAKVAASLDRNQLVLLACKLAASEMARRAALNPTGLMEV